MSKLHELLAAEKTVNASWQTLYEETLKKLPNDHFFEGFSKSLKMLEDSDANRAIEAAAEANKVVPTTVKDTLDYALDFYAKAEDLQLQKNLTNAHAKADLVFRGELIAANLPVDQLLGLEARLSKIRALMLAIPTLNASVAWQFDELSGHWVSPPERTVKTEKVMVPVILAPATDKHPAQVKESTKDVTIGQFTQIRRSGAATAVEKADAIATIDELIAECKKARMRANDTEVVKDKIGSTLKRLLMSAFNK